MTSSRVRSNRWTGRWPPETLAVLAAAAVGILSAPLNWDAAWYLVAARRFLAGDRLYVDVLDVNPPLVFWLFSLPAWLGQQMGVADEVVVSSFAGLLVVGSGLSAVRVLSLLPAPSRIYLFGKRMVDAISGNASNWKLALLVILLSVGVFATCAGYIRGLTTLPIASNNIYEQHYQMHRFAKEYYGKPVAVQDIGYVAYRNGNYVLDLVGLASIDSARYQQDRDSSWMQRLAERHRVELAMVTAHSFKALSANWIKVGAVHLGKERITPFASTVTFYALTDSAYSEAKAKLPDFAETLPDGVTFTYER